MKWVKEVGIYLSKPNIEQDDVTVFIYFCAKTLGNV